MDLRSETLHSRSTPRRMIPPSPSRPRRSKLLFSANRSARSLHLRRTRQLCPGPLPFSATSGNPSGLGLCLPGQARARPPFSLSTLFLSPAFDSSDSTRRARSAAKAQRRVKARATESTDDRARTHLPRPPRKLRPWVTVPRTKGRLSLATIGRQW